MATNTLTQNQRLTKIGFERLEKEIRVRRARVELDMARAQLAALKAEQKRLSLAPAATEQVQIWCADYTTNLTGTVGTIEIPDERSLSVYPPIIQPGHNGNAVYNQARDGKLQPAVHAQPFNYYYNKALMPAWQLHKPHHRLGTITAIDGGTDTCTVNLDPAFSSEPSFEITKPYDINLGDGSQGAGSLTLTNVPIEYSTCNSSAFAIDDRVVVKLENQDWATPKVIGFESNPRVCSQWTPWDEGTLVPIDSTYYTEWVGRQWLNEYTFDVDENGKWWIGVVAPSVNNNFKPFWWFTMDEGDTSTPLIQDLGVTTPKKAGILSIGSIFPPTGQNTKPSFIGTGGFSEPTWPATHGLMYSQSRGYMFMEYTDDEDYGTIDLYNQQFSSRQSGHRDQNGSLWSAYDSYIQRTDQITEEVEVAIYQDDTRKITIEGPIERTSFFSREGVYFAGTSTDKMVCIYDFDATNPNGQRASYRYSDNGGLNWSAKNKLAFDVPHPFQRVRAKGTRSFDGNPRQLATCGETFLWGGNNTGEGLITWTRSELDLTSWNEGLAVAHYNAFPNKTGVWSLSITSSANGQYFTVTHHGNLDVGGQWISLGSVDRTITSDVRLNLEEEFQLIGNPNYQDPVGSIRPEIFAKQVNDGTVYVAALVYDSSKPVNERYKIYRRKRLP